MMEGDVNCRIGSLENTLSPDTRLLFVNCRIGSLENIKNDYLS